MYLKGLGVAMVTPFHPDGTIDFESIPRVVEHIVSGQADYLVVLGTTAEVACLSAKEKRQVVQAIVSANQNRLPLVIGIGGNNTAQLVAEIQATDLSAFGALLSVSPYYNKPTQEGIYHHFAELAKASPLPIIVYNVPSRTGSSVEASTFIRLSQDFENIIAIKEASGSMLQAQEIIKEAKAIAIDMDSMAECTHLTKYFGPYHITKTTENKFIFSKGDQSALVSKSGW